MSTPFLLLRILQTFRLQSIGSDVSTALKARPFARFGNSGTSASFTFMEK